AHVVQVDIEAEVGLQAAEQICAAGGSASAIACDVANEEQVNAMIAEAVAGHGGIDIFINNAGLHSAAYNQSVEALGIAKIQRLFDVNIMGTLLCTHAAHNAMKGRPNASIVNISSSAAYGCQTAYGVSKLAVQGLTMMSAREYGADGIRVNAIAPGLMFTDTIRAELPKETVDVVMAQQCLKVEGLEKDIVAAMLYLVSEGASFVTGETLRVSGGFTLQI
ncbi:MAG: SDR family NAD(P)-dependent oxidoreductase, partial [Acidimicrobiia bacterium]